MREKFGVSRADFLARFNITEEDIAARQPQPAVKRAPARPREAPRGIAPSLDRLQSELQGKPAPAKPAPAPPAKPAKPVAAAPAPAPMPQQDEFGIPTNSDLGLSVPPSVEQTQQVQQEVFPDWIDTSRLPTSDEEPEDDGSGQNVELVDWSFFFGEQPSVNYTEQYEDDEQYEEDDDDDDEEPAYKLKKQISKVDLPQAEIEPEPDEQPEPYEQNDLGLVENARQYLLQLDNEDEDTKFKAVTDAIRHIEDLLKNSPFQGKKKQMADAFGFVIGSLQKIYNDRKTLGENADEIIQAVYTLKTHYSNLANDILSGRRGISEAIKERLNQQIDYITRGPKKAPLQRRTSKWHNTNTIWERNRIIDIMQLDDNFQYDLEMAEDKARDEWNRIVEVVDELLPDSQETEKEKVRQHFATIILGEDDGNALSTGMDFEAAEKFIRETIGCGFSNVENFEKDVEKYKEYTDEDGKYVSEEDQAFNAIIMYMYDEGKVEEEIENLPEEYSYLIPIFVQFGREAGKFIKLGADAKDSQIQIEGIGSGTELKMEAQKAYEKAMSLYIKIRLVETPIKMMAEDEGQIFKEAYKIKEVMREYIDTFGIEQDYTERNISASEIKDIGSVEVDNQGRTKRRRENRDRKWETEQRARDRFLELLRYSGRIWDYYKKRSQYMRDKRSGKYGVEERDLQLEKDRLLNDANKLLGHSIKRWKVAAAQMTEANRKKYINEAIELYNRADKLLFKRMAESWLDDEELAKHQKNQLEKRHRDFDNLLFEIENPIGQNVPGTSGVKYRVPIQVNYNVVEALRNHIAKIDEKWEMAKREAQEVEVQKFKPGEKSEKDRDERLARKVRKSAWMADVFFRYAKMCG